MKDDLKKLFLKREFTTLGLYATMVLFNLCLIFIPFFKDNSSSKVFSVLTYIFMYTGSDTAILASNMFSVLIIAVVVSIIAVYIYSFVTNLIEMLKANKEEITKDFLSDKTDDFSSYIAFFFGFSLLMDFFVFVPFCFGTKFKGNFTQLFSSAVSLNGFFAFPMVLLVISIALVVLSTIFTKLLNRSIEYKLKFRKK